MWYYILVTVKFFLNGFELFKPSRSLLILLLEEDKPHVRGASKVSLADLLNILNMLQLKKDLITVMSNLSRVQTAVPDTMYLKFNKQYLLTYYYQKMF